MTDANLVTRLRNGADRFIAFVRKEQYPGPSVYSIPRHHDNIDCLLMESADALAKIKAENQRLRGVLETIATTGRCEFAVVRAALRSTEASYD